MTEPVGAVLIEIPCRNCQQPAEFKQDKVGRFHIRCTHCKKRDYPQKKNGVEQQELRAYAVQHGFRDVLEPEEEPVPEPLQVEQVTEPEPLENPAAEPEQITDPASQTTEERSEAWARSESDTYSKHGVEFGDAAPPPEPKPKPEPVEHSPEVVERLADQVIETVKGEEEQPEGGSKLLKVGGLMLVAGIGFIGGRAVWKRLTTSTQATAPSEPDSTRSDGIAVSPAPQPVAPESEPVGTLGRRL